MKYRMLVKLALLASTVLVCGCGSESSGAEAPALPPANPPNVLVIVMDTLRADALGTYGQKRPTSPNIDKLAAESVVWENAWTQYTWTLPSFVSYMTSSWARTHGWDYTMGKLDTYKKLDAKAPTLSEVFSSAGYITEGRYANMHLKAELGFGRGFDTWKLAPENSTVREAVASIGRWKDDDDPNFLYVHLMAPHVALLPSPEAQAAVGVSVTYEPKKGLNYDHVVSAPPELKKARKQEFRDAYHACVWDGDQEVGQILSALEAAEEAGAAETIVAFWSDHGEMLGEHNHVGHNQYVWQEVVTVPLFIKAPGLEARRESKRIGRLIDAAPTLVELAGLHVPDAWQGQSLFTGDQPIVGTEREGLAAFTRGKFKVIEDRAKEKFLYAFDLGADPRELTQIKAAVLPPIATLLQHSAAWRQQVPKGTNTGAGLELSAEEHAETVQQLEALGYTDD